MKRFTAILLASLLTTAALSACGQTGPNEKISVVCTVFPQYDWVRQILGDKADSYDLTLLLDNSIDLHNYQPSVDDIVKISACDLLIYVGGGSDGWVRDALNEAANTDMVVIDLLDMLGGAAKFDETIEGIEDGYHGQGAEEDGHVEGGYDEHVWLSLRNAEAFCGAIADALSSLDAGNADAYQSNKIAYIEKLSDLDAEYRGTVGSAPVRTLLFGDRFPFRYLVDDYGISYYAAFDGCSAESEASFATVVFLAQKMDELRLPCVMVTESSDQSIARTIVRNTVARDYKICVLDAMQSVSSSDVRNGTTYLSIMESNLEVLKEALGS